MVLILHALGVLVVLLLIAFGVVSVTIIQESKPKQLDWAGGSHPKTLEMLKKHKEAGMFSLEGENYVETTKKENLDRR